MQLAIDKKLNVVEYVIYFKCFLIQTNLLKWQKLIKSYDL